MSTKKKPTEKPRKRPAQPAAFDPAEGVPETGRVHPALAWIAVAALFGSVLVFSAGKLSNFDIWWHLSVGRQIVQTRSLAAIDDLNHTHRGLPYENECWLFDAASYGLWKAGAQGEALVMARILVFLAAFGLTFLAVRRMRVPIPLATALVYLAALVILHRFFMRNFAVGYVFFAGYLLALTSRQAVTRDRRLLVALPVAMIFWANIHVGCVMGVILAGLYFASAAIDYARKRNGTDQIRFAALLLVLVVAASGVSPYPFEWARRIALNLFVYPASQAMEEIPPAYAQFQLFYWVAAIAAALLAARVRRLSTFIALAFAFTTLMAMRHVRFIGEFGFVLPVFLAHAAAPWLADDRLRRWTDSPRLAGVVAVLVSVTMVGLTARIASDRITFGAGPNCRTLPCQAIDFIRTEGIDGPFYNMLGWGGFFTWNLYPDQRAFWDGRFKAQIGLFEAFRDRPAQDVLAEHGVRFALIPFPRARKERSDLGLIGIERDMLNDPANWTPIYFDEVAVVLARRVPENGPVIALHGFRVLRPWRLDFGYVDLRDARLRERVEQDLALAQARQPDEPLPLYLTARYRQAVGDVEDAERIFQQGIAAYPDAPLFPAGLGALRLEQDRYEEAIAALESALALDPANAYALNNLGVTYLKTGEIQKARWRFVRAIDVQPSLAESYYNLAGVYMTLGDRRRAEKYQAEYERLTN